MRTNYKLLKFIHLYLKHEEKQREIIRYLYNNTELFEKKYMQDFPEELFRFFAGKITRFSTEYNKIYSLLDKNEVKTLKEIELEEI